MRRLVLCHLATHWPVEPGDLVETPSGQGTVVSADNADVAVKLPGGTLTSTPAGFDMAMMDERLARPRPDGPVDHAGCGVAGDVIAWRKVMDAAQALNEAVADAQDAGLVVDLRVEEGPDLTYCASHRWFGGPHLTVDVSRPIENPTIPKFSGLAGAMKAAYDKLYAATTPKP